MPKVLIAEQNQRVADVLSSFLKKKGMEADIAGDGISAMRFFVGKAYDLLIVNLELPFMTGDALSRKIRENGKGKDVPIIMMSGVLKNEARINEFKTELRLHGFLIKPFNSDTLSALLATVQAPKSDAPVASPASPPQAAPAQSRRPQTLKGNLGSTPFEKVLFYIFKKRGTGVLTMERDNIKEAFFFIDGGVAEMTVNAGDADLGSYLLRKNLIEEAELREYREQRKSSGEGDPRDIFVKMGCMTPEQLAEESRSMLHDRLVDGFSWKSGTVQFEWAPSFLRQLPSASALMPVLFFRGFKAKLRPAAISAFLEEKAGLFAGRTRDFFEYQNHFADEPGAAAFDLIDGTRTCSGITSRADSEEAALLLYTMDYLQALFWTRAALPTEVLPPFPLRDRAPRPQLLREKETFEDLGGELRALSDEVAGLDALKPQPQEESAEQRRELSTLEEDLKKQWEELKDKNYYEIFGMRQNAFSFDKLKKSYFQFTRTYGPDKFFASSSETMSLAEELLSRISNAYETLSNVVSKENYDEILASQEEVPSSGDDKEFYEQIQFQSGKVFIDQGQYESAEKAFMNCVNIEPEKPEYLAYLALAVYNNPASRGNPAARKRAKDLVNKSLQLGKLSIAYALKGTMYLDEGGINFAEAEFNKALKFNPNNKTALKKLEEIRIRRQEEKKNIFQRMFK